MSNKIKNDTYPVTKSLELTTSHLRGNNKSYTVKRIREIFIEVVNEYEHGTADVEDVEGVTIKQYSAVANDLLLCIEDFLEPGEENES